MCFTLSEWNIRRSVLRAQGAKLKLNKLGDDERRLLTLFQKAVSRRDAGQPDYAGLSWSWEQAAGM
jgi:hypothetical protein